MSRKRKILHIIVLEGSLKEKISIEDKLELSFHSPKYHNENFARESLFTKRLLIAYRNSQREN